MPETRASTGCESPSVHAARASDGTIAFRLLTDRDLECLGEGIRQRILGTVRYTDRPGTALSWGAPLCTVPLETLEGEAGSVVLLGRSSSDGGRVGDIEFRSDGDTLFGVVSDESATPAQIEQASYRIYQQLLQTAGDLGFPYVCRIWNYLPDINAAWKGLEVYRAFSIGRRHAFDETARVSNADLPAACAIGTRSSGLRVCFLASRHSPSALSNLRQIEAYRYPPEYGPKSPAFSRAMLVPRGADWDLHISGTASIIGHRTVHEGAVGRQIDETLRNLAALLRPLGLRLADASSNTLLTIYLRRAGDLPEAKALLAATVAPEVKRLFLQGDICRRSLLVEIEGIIAGVDGNKVSRGSLPVLVPGSCDADYLSDEPS